jgi:uracil-DNA glycosylase
MTPKSSAKGSIFSEGPENAGVMLVGQNPGKEEVR